MSSITVGARDAAGGAKKLRLTFFPEMMKHLLLFFALALAVMPLLVAATPRSTDSKARKSSVAKVPKVKASKVPKKSAPKIKVLKAPRAPAVPKKRSPSMRAAFQRLHPCPTTRKKSGSCPGYVVDHIRPLACGGADNPGNMQWQTEAAAKLKDKYERAGC